MNPYSTPVETGILRWYASRAKKGVVEIGVLNGDTSRELAEMAKVPMYGIDPFIPDSMDPSLQGDKNAVLEKMKGYKNFTLLSDYSWKVVDSFKHEFDMIFIDGDHRYEAVKKDVDQWWPKLAVNGVMFIHDSAHVISVPSEFKGHAGPVQLVEELSKLYEKIGTWDTLTGFKKRETDFVAKPKYTVGYAFHGQEDLVPRVMEGLAKNIGGKAEYIFILDGCPESLTKAVKTLSKELGTDKVRFIDTPDIFELASNNLLLKNLRTAYLIIFQEDMVLKDANLLKNLDVCIDKYPYSIGVIGGRAGFFSGYADMSCSAFDKNKMTSRILMPGETAIVWMVNRGPLIISAELMKTIGIINTEYAKSGAYSEMDYCLRAAAAGFINVVMGIDMEHIRNQEQNKLLWKLDSEARETFIKKWPEVRI